MPAVLAACPTLGNALPNTGSGGWTGLSWLALLGLAVAIAILRRRGGRRAWTMTVLVASSALGLTSATAAADCGTAATTPAGQVYAATTFKMGGAEPNIAVSPSG
jgi:LPXTG-motif cell wall-anchored protein